MVLDNGIIKCMFIYIVQGKHEKPLLDAGSKLISLSFI